MKPMLTLLTLLFSLTVTPAYAYLDPGTGSMVVSTIVAIIATGIYMGKDFFYSLKNRKKKKK